MAPARLTDQQKRELAQRFRQGESTQALAEHFGCSPTTVTRLVRAEIGDEAYGALREERQKKGARDKQIPLAIGQSGSADGSPAAAQADPAHPAQTSARQTPLTKTLPAPALAEAPALRRDGPLPAEITAADGDDGDQPLDSADGPAKVLAIDDADDFGEDEGEEDLGGDEEEDDAPRDAGDFHTVAVLPIGVDDQRETRPAPWSPAVLPSCAYLLVDKTVELQARALGEMPELGMLPSEERDRQALVLFTNPRQAKRQCGRTQRVIKLPDPALLGRTAPYLLAQGISRVVIEGALYALPEHQSSPD